MNHGTASLISVALCVFLLVGCVRTSNAPAQPAPSSSDANPPSAALGTPVTAKRARDNAEWEAKLAAMATHLTPRAREALTPQELDDILKGPPRPGFGFDDARYRRRGFAMQKVASSDPRVVA